ncbi:MAG TPA: hypothetical protein VK846_15275 [Candidatus Limnocylindria bacterium]|nr:hypothetical protein [Candidatus Limnocylindria bacterium]
MVDVTRRFLLFFCLPVLAVCQAKPDFSGRWRMIKAKSEFHGFKTPDIIVRTVDHHDPTLNLHTVQTTSSQTSISDISYFTDGSTANNVINGRNAQSRAYWDGAALVVHTDMKNSKGEVEQIDDRWELSEDGQTLTTKSHIVTEKGEADLTLVCSKEGAKP